MKTDFKKIDDVKNGVTEKVLKRVYIIRFTLEDTNERNLAFRTCGGGKIQEILCRKEDRYIE